MNLKKIVISFFEHCDKCVDNVDRADVISWYSSLCCSNSTKEWKLSKLTNYFSFCINSPMSFCKEQPVDRHWKARGPNNNVLSKVEIQNYLDATRNRSMRDKTIIHLFLTTNILTTEICSLKIKDIDFKTKSLKISREPGKERTIILNNEAILLLKCLVAGRNNDQDHIFVTYYGKPLEFNGIIQVTIKIGKMAGLAVRTCPNALKNSQVSDTGLINEKTANEYIKNVLCRPKPYLEIVIEKNRNLSVRAKDQITEAAVNDYFKQLLSVNFTLEYIKECARVIKSLINCCQKALNLILSDDVFNWFKEFRRGKVVVTQHSNLYIISNFFSSCINNQYCQYQVVKKRWFPRKPKRTSKALNLQEQAIFNMNLNKLSLRNRCILMLFRDSGIRRGELRNIQIKDINFAKRSIYISGKSKSERIVFFSQEFSYLLNKLLSEQSSNEPYLFLNQNRKQLSGSRIYQIVTNFSKDIKMKKLIYPHKIRHTYGTYKFYKGTPLRKIMLLMGHENETTTLGYVEIIPIDLIIQYRLCFD